MLRSLLAILLFAGVAVAPAARAGSPLPAWDCCEATTAAPGQVSLFCTPSGSGAPLTAARALGVPGVVDATITLTLRDDDCVPIYMYPSEDLWLHGDRYGLAICAAGTIADGPTDAGGRTTFRAPLRAGGQSDAAAGERLWVIVAGSPLDDWPLAILCNSPDIDGNLSVNLSDTVLYAQDLQAGAYAYRSDFHYDGELNLSDTVLYSRAIGAACP